MYIHESAPLLSQFKKNNHTIRRVFGKLILVFCLLCFIFEISF